MFSHIKAGYPYLSKMNHVKHGVFFFDLLLGKCSICYVEISLALNIHTWQTKIGKRED